MTGIEPIGANEPASESVDVMAENIEALRGLFPNLVTEGAAGAVVDLEVLKTIVGDKTAAEGDEKYGLSWHGKRQALQLAQTPSTGTLRPCPEDSVDWDTTKNLMIEGDNLEVLKLLQKSYAGKVKLIYIDPPYNTGKDFVYKDNYRDNIKNYLEQTGQTDAEGHKTTSNTEASGRYHTDWLNMMYPRLVLARNLLREDGTIAVSIDDGEVSNLRALLDVVFGEPNFIANVIWEKKYTRANDAKFISANHDHILLYSRNFDVGGFGRIPREAKQLAAYSNPDDHPKGVWKATPLHARSGSNTSGYKFRNGRGWAPPKGTYRRFSDSSMQALEDDHAIWFGTDGKQVPSRKSFLSEMEEGIVPVTIWKHEFAGNNHQAADELKALNLGRAFDSPKPTKLIDRILQVGSDASSADLILDFFAGSGTTGHAVMAQNTSDGGNRRYLLVQLPELLDADTRSQIVAAEYCDELGKPRNIAELTKERLRRAAAKVAEENPEYKGDLGFRVFKLDSSNLREWDENPDDLPANLEEAAEHVKADRTDQDVLYELLLKQGIDLCVPIETKEIAGHTVQSVGGGTLITCLDQQISQEDTEPLGLGIANWHKELEPAGETTCIFRDSAFPNDIAKTNLTAILNQHNITTIRSI